MIELMKDLPRPIAFALGGGGSYGAVQVGQLKALAQTDVVPDMVIGTSVGSLNATIVAQDPVSAADRLDEIWSGLSHTDVFGSVKQSIAHLAALHTPIADNASLRSLIEQTVPLRTFEDLQLPLSAVATSVSTGTARRIDSGDLVSALMASAAIPGVFPLVQRDGEFLMDGGLTANVPIGEAGKIGAQTIVVLDCGFSMTEIFPAHEEPLLHHLLMWTAAIASDSQVQRDLARFNNRTILYVPGKWPPGSSPFEFDAVHNNKTESFDIALDWLERLEVTGPGLYGKPPGVAEPANGE